MSTPKGGRPPIGPQRAIRFDPHDWAAVVRLARLNRISQSEQVRRLLALGLQVTAEQATSARTHPTKPEEGNR